MNKEQLENVFWAATCKCLGISSDPQNEQSSKRVRISWPQSDTGNSDWKRHENVIFLRISPGTDEYGTLYETDHAYDPEKDQLKEVINYHRCHRIMWVCYGPDSGDDADAIRIAILTENVMSYLRAQKIAIIPHIREPVRMTEMDENGEWWERHDLTCECYELVTREYDIEHIEHVPNIILTYE